MSTSRVGETFDERPMTELMGLCTFLLAPMWSSWAFNKSSATECGGKKRLSCVGNKKENLWLLKVGLLKSPNCKSRLPVCGQCRPILKSH